MRNSVLLTLFILAACSARGPEQVVFSGDTMGTQFTVKIIGDAGTIQGSDLDGDIEAVLHDVNAMMSTYILEADISQFNAADTLAWFRVPREFCLAVEHALELSVLTDGAFDVTAAPLVNLWGFGPPEMEFEPPADDVIEAARATVGFENLGANCRIPAIRRKVAGVEIDFSAYGKGYAVDKVVELLLAKGYEDFLVEIGGEIRVAGDNSQGKAWAIGIEIPRAGVREPYTIVRLTDFAVATSGDYRNFFEHEGVRYSHEINTRTGRPVTHELAAVSIIDESAATADAMATGLLILGPDAGFELAIKENIAAMFLTRTDSGVEERVTPRFEELARRL